MRLADLSARIFLAILPYFFIATTNATAQDRSDPTAAEKAYLMACENLCRERVPTDEQIANACTEENSNCFQQLKNGSGSLEHCLSLVYACVLREARESVNEYKQCVAKCIKQALPRVD